MGLLEQRPPASAVQRTQQSAADQRATWIAVVAFCCTLASIIGLPGNGVFMGAAPVIALGFGFIALMGVRMERFRGGFARLVFAIGAVAFVAFGLAYAGKASTVRVVVAYFIPAVLFALSALTLNAPRRQAA